MDKKFYIKNPLSIIALFAGTAEISGSIILPLIDATNQSVFVWFLMLFPTLLVIAFFITLNFNHRVLYAPSDYTNEENFIKLIRKSGGSSLEKLQKTVDEEAEYKQENSDQENLSDGNEKPADIVSTPEISKSNASSDPSSTTSSLSNQEPLHSREFYEEAVFSLLEEELPGEVFRNIRIGEKNNYLFDGSIVTDRKLKLIEVKIIHSFPQLRHFASKTLDKIQSSFSEFEDGVPPHIRESFQLIIVIVNTIKDQPNADQALERIVLNKIRKSNVSVRVYNEHFLKDKVSRIIKPARY